MSQGKVDCPCEILFATRYMWNDGRKNHHHCGLLAMFLRLPDFGSNFATKCSVPVGELCKIPVAPAEIVAEHHSDSTLQRWA